MQSSKNKKPNDRSMMMLSAICLDERNINVLVKNITENVRISDKSIPRCTEMIIHEMERNLARLSRPPKDREETKEIVYFLNKTCLDNMMDYLIKKFPQLQSGKPTKAFRNESSESSGTRRETYPLKTDRLNPKGETYPLKTDRLNPKGDNPPKQVVGVNPTKSKEKIKRDMDVYGDRLCHVSDRPHANTSKTYVEEDDDQTINMNPNDTGFVGSDRSGGNYASPWDNYSIMNNVPAKTEGQPFNNPHKTPQAPGAPGAPDEFDHRYQTLMSQRNFDIASQHKKPQDIDFSLDNNKKKSQETNNNEIMPMGTFNSNSSGIDDFYASILGSGAPATQGSPGNIPAAPQVGNHDGKQNARSQQFQSDYERHMEERMRIDMETGQPKIANPTSPPNTTQPMMSQPSFNQPMNQPVNQPSFNQPISQQQMNQPMYQFMMVQ